MNRLRVHISSLIEAGKELDKLKMYTLFLNLRTFYKSNSIHNYKGRYQELCEATGFKDSTFRKYLNLLIKNKICDDWNGNLQIFSAEKMSIFLGVKYYYDLDFKHTKRKYLDCRDYLRIEDLQLLLLELKRKQKQYKIFKKIGEKENLKCSIKKVIFNNSLASFKLDQSNLYLQDIQKIFGFKTKQGASNLIKRLESKKLLESTQQYSYLKKLPEHNNFRDKGFFIKNDWFIQQLPNHLEFEKQLKIEWWEECIENYFVKVKKEKALKIKHNKDIKRFIDPYYKPIQQTEKKMCKLFIDLKTGEVVHEQYYSVIKDLTIKGYSVFKKFHSDFKKLDLKIYKKVDIEIDEFPENIKKLIFIKGLRSKVTVVK